MIRGKAYTVLSRQSYADIGLGTQKRMYPTLVDQIAFDDQDDDSPFMDGEAFIEFHKIGTEVVPTLKMYDDSWGMFSRWPALFSDLAKMRYVLPGEDVPVISMAEVEAVLRSHGFVEYQHTGLGGDWEPVE